MCIFLESIIVCVDEWILLGIFKVFLSFKILRFFGFLEVFVYLINFIGIFNML